METLFNNTLARCNALVISLETAAAARSVDCDHDVHDFGRLDIRRLPARSRGTFTFISVDDLNLLAPRRGMAFGA